MDRLPGQGSRGQRPHQRDPVGRRSAVVQETRHARGFHSLEHAEEEAGRGLRVSLKVIIPAVAVTAAFFFFAVGMALRAQRRKVVSGREGMVGALGEVRTALIPQGAVFVAGEHWTAVSENGEAIPAGTTVEVVSVDHLKITVRPAAR